MENNQVETTQAAVPSSKGMSIAALVCGIIGVVACFIPAHLAVVIAAFVLSILGIIFGAKGMKRANSSGEGKGLAVAGLVLGIVGTVCSGIAVLCVACAAAAIGAIGAAL